MGQINYEFGETTGSHAFWERHPDIWPQFERLIALTNKCFGREYQPKSRAEHVVFDLGQACRDDFGEIIFLAVHGHGNGATKLLRGIFERAVTAAYLIKNSDKAERFVRFGAIQEHRAMESALKVVSETEFDEVLGKRTSGLAHGRNHLRERRQQVGKRAEQTADCRAWAHSCCVGLTCGQEWKL